MTAYKRGLRYRQAMWREHAGLPIGEQPMRDGAPSRGLGSVLAMLQHPSGQWVTGRFVLVHPAENVGFARVAREYADLLTDSETFEVRTVEDLLDTGGLPDATVTAFRDRYLTDHPAT